jgi:hypothetical protein
MLCVTVAAGCGPSGQTGASEAALNPPADQAAGTPASALPQAASGMGADGMGRCPEPAALSRVIGRTVVLRGTPDQTNDRGVPEVICDYKESNAPAAITPAGGYLLGVTIHAGTMSTAERQQLLQVNGDAAQVSTRPDISPDAVLSVTTGCCAALVSQSARGNTWGAIVGGNADPAGGGLDRAKATGEAIALARAINAGTV